MQGCYTPQSEANKFKYDQSNHETLHRFSAEDTSFHVMTLGTYEIPQACQRYCFSIYNSTLWAIQSFKCYCLDEEATLKDFKANSNTLASYTSCPASQIAFEDHFSYGFASLNFPPQFVENLPLRPHYCGSNEIGGGFRCGSRDQTDTTAAIYGFTNFQSEDISYSTLLKLPLTVFDVVVDVSASYTVGQFQTVPITFAYPFCHRPCLISENENECNCSSRPIWFRMSFGDGHIYSTYRESFAEHGYSFSHYFNKSGNFALTFSVRNSVFENVSEKKVIFTVIKPIESVELNATGTSLVLFGDALNFIIKPFVGEHFTCNINYGDGSPIKTNFYENIDSVEPLFYRYRELGLYKLTIACSVGSHVRSVMSWVVVQDVVIGLQSDTDSSISYNQVYQHRWSLLQGSHVCCKVFMGSHLLKETSSPPDLSNVENGKFFFDRNTNEGIALIPIPTNENYGTYAVTAACSNTLTVQPEVAVSYISFDTPVKDVVLTFSSGKSFYKVNEKISLSLSIASGTNFLTRWSFGKNSDQSDIIEFCNKAECKSR